ncbi:NADPH-dependent FMN reductase [Actinomadura sp. 9N407]|uniref:NADPH-dependent FMN reductase n=1 Tax=Actinomadura sp. 9N407 TaxID=3375154 RepID=UPI0037BDDC39
MAVRTAGRRPLIVGVGGTGRFGSTTERALLLALRGAEDGGAEVVSFDGAFLAELPLFRPGLAAGSPRVRELLAAVARSDGLIVASPSYHGGVSALVKNALDHMELLREEPRPYLDRRAVGCVVTAAGGQAGGVTLAALRSIVHALRGWPTPLGATVTTSERSLQAGNGDVVDASETQLRAVGHQVVEFAMAFGTATAELPAGTGAVR